MFTKVQKKQFKKVPGRITFQGLLNTKSHSLVERASQAAQLLCAYSFSCILPWVSVVGYH